MAVGREAINDIRNRLSREQSKTDVPRIAIVHPDLMMKGGAEAVCINIIEALQNQYDVDLLTVTKPDLEELNDFYGTSVENISIKRLDGIATSLVRGISKPLPLELKLDGLQWALLDRYAKNIQNAYDLVISTRDEIAFEERALQYVHMPTQATIIKKGRETLPGYVSSSSFIYKLYDRFRFKVAGYSPNLVSKDRLLTNSEWTANVIEEVYNTSPTVVYPPIDKRGFSSVDWKDREKGFVMIGRISPEKRILEALEIINELHRWDDDIHIHIIGTVEVPEYMEEINQMAEPRGHIHIEQECSRGELIDLIQRHKYGLHSKKFEHFGMTVAEMVAGGAIPFVHNSGGQTDIVLNEEHLIYDDTEEAVRKVKKVVDDRDQQRELREVLASSVHRFSKQTFQQHIKEVVSSEIKTTNDN